MTPRRIVITGGSGFVGRALCERLAEAWPGCRLVVPTRHLPHARAVQCLPNVELLRCDLNQPAQLAAALQGADALVHLVAVLHGDAARFDRVHVALPRTLAAAVRAAGVRRVVHVSALGVAADAPSNYLRSKAAGEAVWRQAEQVGDTDVRILRPSVIFGEDDRFTNLFAGLLKLFPLLPLAGTGARFQPVWVGDVAQAIVALVGRDDLAGATLEAAGPEVLSLGQIIARVGAMSGHARPLLPLPEWAGMLQAAGMALLPGEPPMSRDNLLSMRVPNVASGTLPGLAALGIAPQPLARLATHFAPARPAYQKF
ncbi:NAD-dependent epimerase/dehydratase family protein [Aquabacterium sp. OR-4]|uniref:NAD-dependent epimerase/dehydratase family protein n=1 Tax=Aquabacterium sp. OR-4 TaxID=2978127 RepID=UPI0021B1A199|nr:NAD-dependent epimerase/dehydratase family protein [Aquabacterium sp. OR-4]MDT7837409.1 NAD-dependent epimerase/dehydratase family protein [Aquabacterium sp. OR-4]